MKKYNVIYADPPWRYKLWTGGGAADEHYPTMSIEDIKALPVDKLAAKDCALFLWITFPMLHEAWDVMRAWGFDFKTVAFVWIKLNRTADTLFWAWDTGREPTRKYVCLPQKAVQNDRRKISIRS